jgi:flagellar biosynthesis/type III secretory pathway protein FliH
MKKAKETDKAYAQGVRDGFNVGLQKSQEILQKSLEEFTANEKCSPLTKGALTLTVARAIIELKNLENK